MATPRATIPDLPEQTAVVDTDLLVVQNGATTKKMTVGRMTTASSSAVTDHINDPTGAHAASAIAAAPNGTPLLGTDVQTQLAQAAAGIATAQTTSTTTQADLTAHLADAVDAHDASAVSLVAGTAPFTQIEVQAFATQVATSVNATTAQSTANASNLTAHLNDTTDVHAASAITVLPAGNLNSTNAQAALAELQVDIDTIKSTPGAIFTSSANGLAPASGGGSVNYLRADGSWSAPAGGGGGGITAEDAVDATAAAFAAGTHTNVTVTYNDTANSISLAASAAAPSTAQTIEVAAGTTYTVVAGDANKIKSMTGTATVTLPSAGPATGERVDFVCVGGPATFALGGGATWHVAPTPSAVARAVGSFVTAIKMGATTWALTGDLA